MHDLPAPGSSPTRPARSRAAGLPAGLIALAVGGFAIGLTEFVIAGLLSQIAADLDVTVPAAGGLVSGYALAVVVGALPITIAARRLEPKQVLTVLMTLFIAGNVLSAVAPTYAVALAGRLIAALCHGAFFGIGSVLAARMAPGRAAGAIAVMFSGLTTANVLGVPLGTLVGQQYGWRAAFWLITGIGVIGLVGIVVLVPAERPAGRANGDAGAAAAPLRAQAAALVAPRVLSSLVVTALVFGGMFGSYTYVQPLLTEVTGFTDSWMPWLLVLFGTGLCAGNIVGAKAADRALAATLPAVTAVLAASIAAFTLTVDHKGLAAANLFLVGAAGFATVPGLQLRVLRRAQAAPDLASAANIAAFNLGNSIGVYLSGVSLDAGWGWLGPTWVGAALASSGLAVLLTADARFGRIRSDAAEARSS